jgi:hypothetical protein
MKLNEHREISIRSIHQLKQRIGMQNIHCVPQFPPGFGRSVSQR